MDDLTLWESLDKELNTMVENFSNLIKAARIPDEESDQNAGKEGRKERAPGDLLELWADKVVYSGYTALHQTSQLKRTALTSDFNHLMENIRKVREGAVHEDSQVNNKLANMRQEVQQLMSELEASYYSSQHRGSLPAAAVSSELAELAKLAMEG